MTFYTIQDVLKNHMQNCGQEGITSIRLGNESHIYWKKHFHKESLNFRIYANFEADNGFDSSIMGNKITTFY